MNCNGRSAIGRANATSQEVTPEHRRTFTASALESARFLLLEKELSAVAPEALAFRLLRTHKYDLMVDALIRPALPSDVPTIAEVHVRSWRVAYRGLMPDDFLAALDVPRRAAWWAQVVVDPNVSVLVSTLSGSVIGFCSFLACRDEDAAPRTCEIATLYLEPSQWRSGFGSALVDRAVDLARIRGFLELSLWVLATNVPARSFYESRGFRADGKSQTHSRLGTPLHEVRYCRPLAGWA